MSSSLSPNANLPRSGRRRAWMILLSVPMAVAAACWWLTAPLDDEAPGGDAEASPPRVATPAIEVPPARSFPDWPEGEVAGEGAKRLLLDTLLTVQERLEGVAGYTATLKKQERINGVLSPEQTLTLKVRHHPFAVYLKYLAPSEGKEVVFAVGHHDNKIIAHSGGLARFLVPRLAVPPDHPLALADTRHAITDVGLVKLNDKLVGFRRLDLGDPDAVTILDRTLDEEGRPWLRSRHEHLRFDPRRPFARIEVLYDPETRLPLRIRNFEWPAPGHEGELLLAERYAYEDLDLHAVLNALDFDPANPAYAFHRY